MNEDNSSVKCPRCDSSDILKGECVGSDLRSSVKFMPDLKHKWHKLASGVPVDKGSHYCRDCYLLWSTISISAIISYLEDKCE